MDSRYENEPLWADEPDWLCSVEFLAQDDPEAQDETAETIGYLLGYAHMTNTRSLALLADAHGVAYEILFSFYSPESKAKFLGLTRSNQDLGNDYADNDLTQPTIEEIRMVVCVLAVAPSRVVGIWLFGWTPRHF